MIGYFKHIINLLARRISIFCNTLFAFCVLSWLPTINKLCVYLRGSAVGLIHELCVHLRGSAVGLIHELCVHLRGSAVGLIHELCVHLRGSAVGLIHEFCGYLRGSAVGLIHEFCGYLRGSAVGLIHEFCGYLRGSAVSGLVVSMVMAVVMAGCRIEPPLNLAGQQDVEMEMPEVITDISVVWDIDADWRSGWWYGWDDDDVRLYGLLEYPVPTSYEVRFYYLGDAPSQPHRKFDRSTVMGSTFRRRFDFGYHDLLFWSNINSHDGSQAVIFDEKDVTAITATTSRSRLGYTPPLAPAREVLNNPEIFYSNIMRNLEISSNFEDYDYFDEERRVWVKRIGTELSPMVYIYLVQYVIYNNNGRIIGPVDNSSISALADGVNLHTGVTSEKDVIVTYPSRMKRNVPARDGKDADIIGGKLTTFGLCGMEPWSKSRAAVYRGPCADLRNHLMVKLQFSNSTDSVYAYDITPQLQRQAHGGVVTIEIDADTLTIPTRPGTGGHSSGFDPVVVPQDTVVNQFDM